MNTKSAIHGEMTSAMLAGIEAEIIMRKPDRVLVYGDTNSTMAGALAAAKLHTPVSHVEAGLRSFNRRMPEEINRILTDHISDLLFCLTFRAVENLSAEGIGKNETVIHTGDVMYDAALAFGEIAHKKSCVLEYLSIEPKTYYLMTLHRAENTDDPRLIKGILKAAEMLAEKIPLVFPIHPRTRKRIMETGLKNRIENFPNLKYIEPVLFLDMVRLEQEAKVILTDSGGVQKEAYFHGVSCVTVRDETEWVETVTAGWNRIARADTAEITSDVECSGTGQEIADYGQGFAADMIGDLLIQDISRTSAIQI